jgi:hypothetical protein
MSTLKATNIKNESSASNNIVLDSGGGVVVSGVTTVTAGSASAPAISFNDSNTGLYSPGADQLALSTGGVGRVFVDASGRFGVGTASPGYALDVKTSAETACRLDSGSGYNAILRFAQAGVNKAFIQYPNGGGLTFGPAGSEAARLDSSGRLLVGTSTARSNFYNTTADAGFLLEGTGAQRRAAVIGDDFGAALILGMQKSGAPGGNTIVVNGDGVGEISFQGNDGSEFVACAQIKAEIDNTPGANDMPGRLVFSTTSDGASSPTERLRIGNNGTHTITASNNSTAVQIRDASNYAGQLITATDGTFQINARTTTVFSRTGSDTESMRIDSSGRLLVGTSSTVDSVSNALLQSSASGGAFLALGNTNTVGAGAATLGQVGFYGYQGAYVLSASITANSDATWSSNDYPTRLVFSTTADGASSPTERMRITSDGDVLFATQTINDLGTLSLTFNPAIKRGITFKQTTDINSPNPIRFLNAAGTAVGNIITDASTTAYNTSSDYRLKENIIPLTGATDRFNQLQVHRFNFIADPDKTVDGFIAHEVQDVVPEAITGEKDAVDDDGNPVYQGIDQSKLVPLLTAALQEAIAKIEVLEQRLNDAGIN